MGQLTCFRTGLGTSGLRSDAPSIEQAWKRLKDSPEVLGIETCVDLDRRSLRTGLHTLFEEDQIHDCTGFCTDWLRLTLAGRYCSLRGGCRGVVEEKDKRFIIRSSTWPRTEFL